MTPPPPLLSCPLLLPDRRVYSQLQQQRQLQQQLQQQQQHLALKAPARDFSSRGQGQSSKYRSWQEQHRQEQLERTRKFQRQQEQQRAWKPNRATVVIGSVAAAGALIFVANQDEAPYTHRRRFLVVSRGEIFAAAAAASFSGVEVRREPGRAGDTTCTKKIDEHINLEGID